MARPTFYKDYLIAWAMLFGTRPTKIREIIHVLDYQFEVHLVNDATEFALHKGYIGDDDESDLMWLTEKGIKFIGGKSDAPS